MGVQLLEGCERLWELEMGALKQEETETLVGTVWVMEQYQ